ncbi:MAG: LysE family translocator [Pseudomonadota bacterium]
MDTETLLLFAATEFILCLTPGPAVFVVVAVAMRSGLRAGWSASAGVVAGSAIYFALSAVGVGALIIASQTLFLVLKWVGAAYLCFLGVKMALPLARRLFGRRTIAPDPLPLPTINAPQSTHWDAFWKGLFGQLANPKTLFFFLALFPQFISPEGNVALQFALMAIVSAVIELPILMAYAALSALSARVVRRQLAQWFEAVAGGVLIAIGTALAASPSK